LGTDSWVRKFATGCGRVPEQYFVGDRARTVVVVGKGWHQLGESRHFSVHLRFEGEDG
jgi:hypothetical protein